MHFRPLAAACAALLVCMAGSANGQQPAPAPNPMAPMVSATTPAPTPTPINSFADVAGNWWGEVDVTSKVALNISPEGVVTMRGVRSFTQQGRINFQRFEVLSPGTDLYCNIMNGFLTCHARFGTWYAALNLKRTQ